MSDIWLYDFSYFRIVPLEFDYYTQYVKLYLY